MKKLFFIALFTSIFISCHNNEYNEYSVILDSVVKSDEIASPELTNLTLQLVDNTIEILFDEMSIDAEIFSKFTIKSEIHDIEYIHYYEVKNNYELDMIYHNNSNIKITLFDIYGNNTVYTIRVISEPAQ